MKLRFPENPALTQQERRGEAGPDPLDLLLFFAMLFPENQAQNTSSAID
jgi:hypothetical protein